MPFKIIKKRFMRKLAIDGFAPYVVCLAVLVALSVALCFMQHGVVLGILVIPVFVGLFAIQMLTDEYTERKADRERAEFLKNREATAHHRAYASAIFEAIRACPPDADVAYRERAINEAAEKFRRTCDKPLPEFLGVQVDGQFVAASQQ